jgi:hypothetical protein
MYFTQTLCRHIFTQIVSASAAFAGTDKVAATSTAITARDFTLLLAINCTPFLKMSQHSATEKLSFPSKYELLGQEE